MTPTVQDLVAERDRLHAHINALTEQNLQTALLLESYEIVMQGPEAIEREMRRLREMIRVVEVSRDQHRTTLAEMKRMLYAQERKLERLQRREGEKG